MKVEIMTDKAFYALAEIIENDGNGVRVSYMGEDKGRQKLKREWIQNRNIVVMRELV